MKYLEECKYIWNNYVPKSGQADILQGELLRQIEKLRYEAQDNGNINWDSNFEWFCDFLLDTLCSGNVLTEEEKTNVNNALARIKFSGQVAYKFVNGEITDEELKEKYHCELAYTDDDLYDIVNDAIGAFYIKNKQPIPYKKRSDIYR